MEQFIEQIKKNLEGNGFPQKRVSLPTEKMYEIADNKGLSLNKVLDHMREQDSIDSEIGVEKIIFTKIDTAPKDFSSVNPEMLGKVQEMMSKMDPEELKRIQEKVANMSEEDKKQMLDQAKGMGLFK